MTSKVTPPVLPLAGPIIKIVNVTESNQGGMHIVEVKAEVSNFNNTSTTDVVCALYEPGNTLNHIPWDSEAAPFFFFKFKDGEIPANPYNINVLARYVVGRVTFPFSADGPRDAF